MIVYEPFKALPLSDFREELEFEFSNLPWQLFDHYLRRTAIDMAERAPVVRRRVYLDLIPNVTRYALSSPDGLPWIAILGAKFVDCCSGGDARRFFDSPDTGCCSPDGLWWDEQEQELHVHRCGGQALRVTMSVRPADDACELPEVYKSRLYSALVMGTRARIMLISGQPWTNLRLGAELLNEYRKLTAEQGVDASLNRQRGTIKMQFGRVM